MTKTTNVFARVEPEVKLQAEAVLSELGIPMSNAISLYLRQIALHHGIPFEIKLPRHTPVALGVLSEIEIDAELTKGLSAAKAGHTRKAAVVHAELIEKYGI